MLSNFFTNPKKRAPADKNISNKQRNELVNLAETELSRSFQTYRWNANIHGVIIQLKTNSFHLNDFWMENWYAAPRTDTILPHGLVYAVEGVKDHEPHAYYNSDTKTAIFVNTEYYGQCKSWALGIAADIMEVQHDIHSIHGSCAVVGGNGMVIIAPTGTGKTTHTFGLLELPNSKIHSDDWIYVQTKEGLAMAYVSERNFYVRTDIVKNFPEFEKIFDKSKCENVENNDFTAFGNSRAMLSPEWIGGHDKFVDEAVIKAVVLLRRDKESPPEVNLDTSTALDILEEGKYQVLSGAGGKIGSFGYEPFYNPYLLVRRPSIQRKHFEKLFECASCVILNTGVETVDQSQARIRRLAKATR